MNDNERKPIRMGSLDDLQTFTEQPRTNTQKIRNLVGEIDSIFDVNLIYNRINGAIDKLRLSAILQKLSKQNEIFAIGAGYGNRSTIFINAEQYLIFVQDRKAKQ